MRQCAVGAGVGVCADDYVTRNDQSFFRQQGVLDAHLSHIVEVGDLLFAAEITAHLALCGSLDVLVGGEVIHDHGHLFFVKDSVFVQLVELSDRNRRGDIVAQHTIQIDQNQLTGSTESRPACAARIFCVIVIPMG